MNPARPQLFITLYSLFLLHCFAFFCVALLCIALLCIALLCSALLYFWNGRTWFVSDFLPTWPGPDQLSSLFKALLIRFDMVWPMPYFMLEHFIGRWFLMTWQLGNLLPQ